MITIVNIGPTDPSSTDPKGEHNYELRLNDVVFASFTHRRSDGLAACLRAAAAAEDERREQLVDSYVKSVNQRMPYEE